jgi:DNA mismatch endonuclease (patch repair protein)
MMSMASIRSKNTRPEILVRRLIHALGYRFRLNRADLPGSPDIVFPSRRRVIFVHGCFWHRHTCNWGCKIPPGKPDYWRAKFEGNVARDARGRWLWRS